MRCEARSKKGFPVCSVLFFWVRFTCVIYYTKLRECSATYVVFNQLKKFSNRAAALYYHDEAEMLMLKIVKITKKCFKTTNTLFIGRRLPIQSSLCINNQNTGKKQRKPNAPHFIVSAGGTKNLSEIFQEEILSNQYSGRFEDCSDLDFLRVSVVALAGLNKLSCSAERWNME